MSETVQRGISLPDQRPAGPDDEGWLLAEIGPDPLAEPWPPQGWEPDPAEFEPPPWPEPEEPGEWEGRFAEAVAALRVLDAVEVGQWRDRLVTATLPEDESGLIDLLRGLEDLKSAACALQARAGVRFDAVRRQREADRGIPASRRGVGVGAEVALARRDSPHRGGRLLGLAKALVNELPQTLQALADGVLNEWRVTLIARESACLDPAGRAEVDAWLAGHLAAHPSIGDARLVAEVRRKVIAIDQTAVLRRRSAAAAGRRVSLRPLPDGMVQLTAILGLREGVAVYAALKKAADHAPTTPGGGDGAAGPGRRESCGPDPGAATGPFGPMPGTQSRARGRGRGAVMADALVARVTGNPAHDPGGVNLTVVIAAEALLGDDEEPAHVDGYGPMPASWVRQLITDTADSAHKVALRRLFRGPGRTVKLETASRFMTPALRHLIALRDHRCRTPWCEAPIRHTDHVHAHASGGTSSWLNGQGLCEACNYTKQHPGWHARAHHDPDRGHIVTVTTPTGHTYESTQPNGPGDK